MGRAIAALALSTAIGLYAHTAVADSGSETTLARALQQAQQLHAAGRPAQARALLEALLARHPDHAEARLRLARLLLQRGDYRAAARQADLVLRQSPDHQSAMLLKADALRRNKDYAAAMALYRRLLERAEHFPARLGLSYALHASGDQRAARANARLLKAGDADEEQALAELQQTLARATRPGADLRYSTYRDTDLNQTEKYAAGFGGWRGNWKWNLDYGRTEARNGDGPREAEEIALQTNGRAAAGIKAGAGVGIVKYKNQETEDFPIGHVKAEVAFTGGRMGARLAREPLTTTADLIKNRIRYTDGTLFVAHAPHDRINWDATYRRRSYSDDNHSRDAVLALRYTALRSAPRLDLGYRARRLRFDRQSRGGYFDPDWFRSHEIFANLSFERGNYYGYLEPALGRQKYFRNQTENDEQFAAGNAALVWEGEHLTWELYAEGGDYAIGTAAGFRYSLFGVRLGYVF